MKTLFAFSMLVVVCSSEVVPSAQLLAMKNFPSFVPSAPWAPSIRLDISYYSQYIYFEQCCRKYTYYPGYETIDPQNDTPRQAVLLRERPTAVTFMSQNNTTPIDVLKNYTLLMVDIDVPFAIAGTRDRPLLHWLVTNLTRMLPNDNATVFPYRGPAPPDQKPHHYVFLLYEQGQSATQMTPASVNKESRYLFDVNGFVRTFNLTLKGVSWLQAVNDPYTNYTKVERDPSTADMYCSSESGWNPSGCVTASSANIVGMTVALLFVPIAVMLKAIA